MASNNSEKIIIVPINVQAMCIGKDDAQQASFIKRNADFSLLPYRDGNNTYNNYANISEHILNSPFESDRHAMPKGVHLHWALPDALTHAEIKNEISLTDFTDAFGNDDGQAIWKALLAKNWLVSTSDTTAKFNNISLLPASDQTLDGDLKARQNEIQRFLDQYQMNFPNVPNRWMITRIYYKDGNVESKRSWVVESDYLSDEDTNALGIKKPNTTVPFQSKLSPKPYRYMGEKFDYPTWKPNSGKEYYPKLTAIGYGDVEFAGYYPNCNSVFGFHDDLNDLDDSTQLTISYQISGWYSNGNSFTSGPFHKSPKDTKELLDQFNWTVSDEEAAISDSIYSGMVIKLVWDSSTPYISAPPPLQIETAFAPNEKEALSALSADGPSQWLFNALQMGVEKKLDSPEGLFEIENTIHLDRFMKQDSGQLWNVRDGDQTDALTPPTDEKELPTAISQQLIAVNKDQEAFNTTSAELLSMRQRIFADWYKYMVKKYDQVPVQEVKAESDITLFEIRQFLEETDMKGLNDLLQKLEDFASSLTTNLTQLDALLKGTKYTLGRTTAPLHYQGNDPVILFKSNGGQIQWEYAGNRNGDAEILTCRLSKDILSEAGITPISLFDGNAPFPDVLTKLINETNIFSNYPTYVAVKAGIEDRNIQGIMPEEIAVTEWAANPWLVMQLHWKVDYSGLKTSDEGQYEQSYITDHFQLNPEHSELEMKTISADLFQQQPQTLKGKCLLTPNAKSNVQVQIDRCLSLYEDHESVKKKLNALKETISSSSILSQALNGFNDALVMNKQTMQLKANDPLRAVFDESFNAMIQNAISGENVAAPLPLNQYHPIRTGLVSVNKMRIVDFFGRFQDVDVSDVVYSKEMTLDTPINSYKALLPPRITQPGRLMFDYLNADSKSTPEIIRYTGASPVCGWILLNILESAFMIYDYDGTALGSLRTAPNDDSIVWHLSPGNKVRPIGEANEYLKNFVSAIRQKKAPFFKEFLKCLESSQPFVDMKSYRQDQGLAPLVGEPIALVRANICLQLKGLPEMNESWAALQKDINNKQGSSQRTTENFTAVKFPVQIGCHDRLSDGLYGFFIGDEKFDTFYTETAGSPQQGIVDSTKITLTPDGSDTTLSMLVQPSNPVYVNSGILPEQFVELPLEKCVDSMNRIHATFLTSPLVINSDKVSVPLSKERGGEWSFLSKKSATWDIAEDILDASNEATFTTSNRKILEGWLQLSKEKGS